MASVMNRRYKTKLHMRIALGGRWGEPTERALCAVRTSDWTSDESAVTCEICLRYMARREADAARAPLRAVAAGARG